MLGLALFACGDEDPSRSPADGDVVPQDATTDAGSDVSADTSGPRDAGVDLSDTGRVDDVGGDVQPDLWSFDSGDGAADTDADPPCGGHGHLHGDHCHCDPGYIPQDGTCVEPEVCAESDAYEPDDGLDEAVEWDPSWASLDHYMCAEDDDFYLVSLTAGGRVLVTAATDDPAHIVTLSVWKPGVNPRYGRTHTVATGTEGETTLNMGVSESGDWLLRVSSATPETQGAYSLSIAPVEEEASPP